MAFVSLCVLIQSFLELNNDGKLSQPFLERVSISILASSVVCKQRKESTNILFAINKKCLSVEQNRTKKYSTTTAVSFCLDSTFDGVL